MHMNTDLHAGSDAIFVAEYTGEKLRVLMVHFLFHVLRHGFETIDEYFRVAICCVRNAHADDDASGSVSVGCLPDCGYVLYFVEVMNEIHENYPRVLEIADANVKQYPCCQEKKVEVLKKHQSLPVWVVVQELNSAVLSHA